MTDIATRRARDPAIDDPLAPSGSSTDATRSREGDPRSPSDWPPSSSRLRSTDNRDRELVSVLLLSSCAHRKRTSTRHDPRRRLSILLGRTRRDRFAPRPTPPSVRATPAGWAAAQASRIAGNRAQPNGAWTPRPAIRARRLSTSTSAFVDHRCRRRPPSSRCARASTQQREQGWLLSAACEVLSAYRPCTSDILARPTPLRRSALATGARSRRSSERARPIQSRIAPRGPRFDPSPTRR